MLISVYISVPSRCQLVHVEKDGRSPRGQDRATLRKIERGMRSGGHLSAPVFHWQMIVIQQDTDLYAVYYTLSRMPDCERLAIYIGNHLIFLLKLRPAYYPQMVDRNLFFPVVHSAAPVPSNSHLCFRKARKAASRPSGGGSIRTGLRSRAVARYCEEKVEFLTVDPRNHTTAYWIRLLSPD